MQKFDMGPVARFRLGASPLVLALVAAGPSWAGTLDDDVLVGTSGDGLILVDEEEGVVAPGVKAVTFTSTREVDEDGNFTGEFLPPYENIITDFTDLERRGEVPNCLMASNPDVYCDSESGSGKRIKTLLTGPTPFDTVLRTTPSELYPTVDYFTFGKIENFTGARITGFSIELRDMDGNLMSDEDRAAAEAVLFNTGATGVGLGARLVDGLFGGGGQEGDIGFFSDARAGFSLTAEDAALLFGEAVEGTQLINNGDFTDAFGLDGAFLSDNMVPDGVFWDDDGLANTESALLAWFDYRENDGDGAFIWGNLANPVDDVDDIFDPIGAVNVEIRLQQLADALGVEVPETSTAVETLGYVPGQPIPDDILALMNADSAFETDAIEDLRNANLNYTFTVGNVEDGQFIVRYAPRFAQIVEETQTAYQFSVAGALDAANIPYLGVQDAGYTGEEGTIAAILAIEDPAEQNNALERLGFSFLGAYTGLGYELARNQVYALGTPAGVGAAGSATVSTQGSPWWQMGDGMQGFVSLGGSTGEVSGTSTGGDYDFTTTDVSFGLKTTLTDGLDGGVILGYGRGDADIDDSRGSLDAEGFAFGGFIEGAIGAAGSFRAFAGVQNLDFDSKRNIDVPGFTGTATGDTDGTVTFAGISADYMAVRGAGYAFGPMGSIEIYRTSVDGFDETGAGIYNISVDDFDDSFTLARLGARGEAMFGQATLRGHIAYASRDGSSDGVQTAFDNILVHTTPLDGQDNDWLDIGLGVSLPLGGSGSQTSLDAEYRGAFSDDYTSHGARLSLQMRF